MEELETAKSDVAVILPTLNEEKSIGYILSELRNVLDDPHLLIIDGNSADETVKIAKKEGAHVMLQAGKGKGCAVCQALKQMDGVANYVVMIDADGSMNPKEIPLYVNALKEGADIVKGSRFLSSGYSEDMSLIRRIGNFILLSLVNLLFSTNYTDLCYGFIAFRKEAVDKLLPLLNSTHFEIETEICIKAKVLGLKIVEVPSIELSRSFGRSRLGTFKDGFRIFLKILKEYF
jgi:glycosyltransferase involved in cell wall biosynthesis